MSEITNENRERWLRDLTDELRPYFASAGYEIPAVVRVSVGWPARGGANGTSLAECWDPTCSADGCPHIFVKPTMGEADVGAAMVHELLHAVMFCKFPDERNADGEHTVRHGKKFKAGCDSLGLEGKPTHTVAGEGLAAKLLSIGQKLGPYPHAILTPRLKEKKQRKAWTLVCSCTPRRVLKGSKETVEGAPVTCGGCQKVMVVERVGPEDEPETPPEDPDQIKLFPSAEDEVAENELDEAFGARFGEGE